MCDFVNLLQCLKTCSKSAINNLSFLAEENIGNAEFIVSAVQKHLAKGCPEVKLATLYLMDSIIKNVKGRYIDLFGYKLDITFFEIFQEADFNLRRKMFQLRDTWKDIFPETTLLNLDLKIRNVDPRWPILGKVELPNLDQLNSKKRSIEQKLAALDAELNQLPSEESTNLEKEKTLAASSDEWILQEPACKRRKFDWIGNNLEVETSDEKEASLFNSPADDQNTQDSAASPLDWMDSVFNKNGQDSIRENFDNNDNVDDFIAVKPEEPIIIEILDDDEGDIPSSSPTFSSNDRKDTKIIGPLDSVFDKNGQDRKCENFDNNGNDDDIIVIEPEEPTIIEILDDDEGDTSSSSPTFSTNNKEDTKIIGNKRSSPSCITSSVNVQDSDGNWINHTTINVKTLLENSVKIKIEPKDDGYGVDDDDLFEDVGEMFDNGPETSNEKSDKQEGSPPRQQTELPAASEVTDIDGNVYFTEPCNSNMHKKYKITIKSDKIRQMTDEERAAKRAEENRKNSIKPIVVPLMWEADETSALCTIM